MPKVFVAMSGGVDSSVAALLLKEAGYEVTGVFMHCYNLDGCLEKDLKDARRVAAFLNIPFYVFNFEKQYKEKVVKYMIKGYKQGFTPNPDVMCNKEIKFDLFLKKALELGADYIATGHYVRLRVKNNSYSLYTAYDKTKDQSYFLWTLNQNQLKYCLFPIGDYLKKEVREIARSRNLPTADKKDSQGICFLGKVTLFDFLKNYIPQKKGLVLTTTGKKLGEHQGVWFYTIGQRHIGIANNQPVYVVDKDIKTNTLIVAEGENDNSLYQKVIKLKDVNFIDLKIKTLDSSLKIHVLARVRYRQPLFAGILTYEPTTNFYVLEFNSPVKFVAPGQSAVFYNQYGKMLGGGVII